MSPVRWSWSLSSPCVEVLGLRWEEFVEKVGFEPGVSEKVMDDESGDDDSDELRSGWESESRYKVK